MSQFRKFQEYLDSKGKLQDKPKVDQTADQVDVPTPKAKEDPLKKAPEKPKPVKEEAEKTLSPFRQRLQAFLDGKQQGMVVEKPKEELVPDYHGPQDTKPPADVTKGKNWDAKTADKAGEAAPYKATNPGKPGAKGESGFGDLGDKKLVYKPDTEKAQLPKTKTEEFIDSTKGMSLGEFSNFVLKQQNVEESNLPTVMAYKAGPIRPYPAETIRYLVALAKQSPRVMENLVHELRKASLTGTVIESILGYPDAYESLAGLLEGDEGIKRCGYLARALRQQLGEAVGPSIGFGDEDGDLNPGKDDDEEEGDEEPEDDEETPEGGEPNDDESVPAGEGGDIGGDKPFGGKPNDMGPPKPPMHKSALAKALEAYGLI